MLAPVVDPPEVESAPDVADEPGVAPELDEDAEPDGELELVVEPPELPHAATTAASAATVPTRRIRLMSR